MFNADGHLGAIKHGALSTMLDVGRKPSRPSTIVARERKRQAGRDLRKRGIVRDKVGQSCTHPGHSPHKIVTRKGLRALHRALTGCSRLKRFVTTRSCPLQPTHRGSDKSANVGPRILGKDSNPARLRIDSPLGAPVQKYLRHRHRVIPTSCDPVATPTNVCFRMPHLMPTCATVQEHFMIPLSTDS